LPVAGPDAMWYDADPALVRCLELAHESFLAGGLPVGSVIAGSNGEWISEGRNRKHSVPVVGRGWSAALGLADGVNLITEGRGVAVL
jgi:hypothetical protein